MPKILSTKELSRAVVKVAEGLFAHAVDMTLWLAIYTAELSTPQSAYGQLWRAEKAADRFLDQVHYGVIKNAIITAKRRGWMKTVGRNAPPEITVEGRRRLAAIIPKYDEKRVWDGRTHLITYDIPERRRIDRETLRDQLRQIGCGRLQDSVWMTPYNPIDTLRSFVQKRNLSGTIIISDLGKDGSIGEEDIRALIVRVYGLDKLSDRYEEWLKDVEQFGRVDHFALIRYLAILRDDPQLPFSLLLTWWKGDIAYQTVQDQLKILSI